jgi:predicted dehydrogenase
VRLAAIADANLELGQDAARRYGYAKALPSWEAVAEDPTIDAVSIVVGNALHRPIAEALLAAGKHVQKPLAGSLEDARAMVELERSTQAVTAVGYTFRRSPAISPIRDHVRAGDLGELTLFSGRYWCDYAVDPNAALSWRFTGGAGTGALGDIGAHVIDTAEYVCGLKDAILRLRPRSRGWRPWKPARTEEVTRGEVFEAWYQRAESGGTFGCGCGSVSAPGHQRGSGNGGACQRAQAARRYSWISPPSTSSRSIGAPASKALNLPCPGTGTSKSRPRCGRPLL